MKAAASRTLATPGVEKSAAAPRWSSRLGVNAARVLIVVAVLAAWEFLPQIAWLRARSPVFDPFFVSSPSLVAERIYGMATGAGGTETMWKYLLATLEGTLIGVSVGTVAGALAGLLFSQSPTLARIMNPFVVLFNATPRIALVPILVIIAGPTLTATSITAVLVVFFLVFYNSFTGAQSVPAEKIQNARLMGATPLEIMRRVRLPYLLVWTFASLPNAVSFGLIAVVTAEVLTGSLGFGRLLSISIQNTDSSLTFSVVVVLTIVGVTLVMSLDLLRDRLLHWWSNNPE
jgi:NitT/TauT family transport system permease protein